jgi:hypothetical protein
LGDWRRRFRGVPLFKGLHDFLKESGVPDFLVELMAIAGFLAFDPISFLGDAFGGYLSAMEEGDIVTKFPETDEFFLGVGLVKNQGFGDGGILDGGPMDEIAAEAFENFASAEIVESMGEFQSVLAKEPISIASLFPIGEVDFVDWGLIKVPGQ